MKHIIRASSIRSFFETPDKWYKNHIEGEDKFEGNTSTYLGTCCHKYAECYYTLQPYSYAEILEDAPEEVDKAQILSEMPELEKAMKKYLDTQPKPQLIEHYMRGWETEYCITQGTIDALTKDGVLVDYKTSSIKKSKIDEYVHQLNIYAYLLSQNDYKVHTLRVVNIIRATKTMEPRINILECPADIKRGEQLLRLMTKKAELAIKNPEYRELIFTENPYSWLN